MNLRTHATRSAAVGLLGAVLVVAGCSSRSEDTIVVGLSADITTFEPGMISSRDNANIVRHVFGSLFALTPEGEHVPELAHTLEISEDGTAYTYTLEEGLTCHDGEPLTAEDVAYTFNRVADPAGSSTPPSDSRTPRRSTTYACASTSPARTPSPSVCSRRSTSTARTATSG
jgi:peptide/nickel transport system substrate-binding protein